MQYEKKTWDEKYRFSKRTLVVTFIIAIILDVIILYFFGDAIFKAFFKAFVFAVNILIYTTNFFVVITWHTVAFAIQNWQLSFVVFLMICFLYAVISPKESKAN